MLPLAKLSLGHQRIKKLFVVAELQQGLFAVLMVAHLEAEDLVGNRDLADAMVAAREVH